MKTTRFLEFGESFLQVQYRYDGDVEIDEFILKVRVGESLAFALLVYSIQEAPT